MLERLPAHYSYFCVVGFALLVSACDSRNQVGYELRDEFDVYVQQVLDDWGAPGVMIVVVEGDQPVYMKGHGSRVLGEDKPIDEATIIQIASNTTPITATAIAMLVDEGRLSWCSVVRPVGRGIRAMDTTSRAEAKRKVATTGHRLTQQCSRPTASWFHRCTSDGVFVASGKAVAAVGG